MLLPGSGLEIMAKEAAKTEGRESRGTYLIWSASFEGKAKHP